MKITPLKEAIKTQLKEHYSNVYPDESFTKYGAQPFADDIDTECHITINDNQSITHHYRPINSNTS